MFQNDPSCCLHHFPAISCVFFPRLDIPLGGEDQVTQEHTPKTLPQRVDFWPALSPLVYVIGEWKKVPAPQTTVEVTLP